MTHDGEVKAVRAVARRLRGAGRADSRTLAAWAKQLDDAARGLERAYRFVREDAESAATARLTAAEGSGVAREAPDRPGPAQRARAARRTSAAAAAAVEPRTGSQRHRILTAVAAVSRSASVGLTDVELASSTGISPNSVRPRRKELVDGGWLEDSGRTRDHHGNEHIVWVLSDRAIELVATGRA